MISEADPWKPLNTLNYANVMWLVGWMFTSPVS